MNNEVKIALVGYGKAGEYFHAPIINTVPGLKIVKVLERHGQRSKEKYPWITVVKNYDELLKDSQIEAVVIATPNWLHFEMAHKALSAGKHVVVDKPFTITSKEADTLIELAKKENKILTAYHNRRWDGGFLTIKKIIEESWIGNIKKFEVRFERYRPEVKQELWRETSRLGAGVLYDIGSHLIDQSFNLFGKPKSIKAEIKTERKGAKADDYFEIILKHENVTSVLKAGMLVTEKNPHYFLEGDLGTYTKFERDPQEDMLKEGKTPLNREWGLEPASRWGFLDSKAPGLKYFGKVETLKGSYESFYQNLYGAIREGKEIAVKPEQAREVVHAIELAFQSSKEKREIEYK
ncbi:MAG: Gfo/Idh/MocA family oxidoreductase [Cytophagaceae bacterium]|nr:Gfo/Idh/MocA family oxidoreductase [Cytophagaceae bacterium]